MILGRYLCAEINFCEATSITKFTQKMITQERKLVNSNLSDMFPIYCYTIGLKIGVNVCCKF